MLADLRARTQSPRNPLPVPTKLAYRAARGSDRLGEGKETWSLWGTCPKVTPSDSPLLVLMPWYNPSCE